MLFVVKIKRNFLSTHVSPGGKKKLRHSVLSCKIPSPYQKKQRGIELGKETVPPRCLLKSSLCTPLILIRWQISKSGMPADALQRNGRLNIAGAKGLSLEPWRSSCISDLQGSLDDLDCEPFD